MIRINLLPIKQDRRREAGRNQLLIGILILALEMVLGFVLYMDVASDVSEQQNKNNSLNTQVRQIESSIAGHDQIIKEIKEFEKRQEAIDNLMAARTGPVYVMLEISRILSKKGRPTIDNERYQTLIKNNPARGYDENWDYRRVWISAFRENDKNITIEGQGVTHEDVAEFLRRINLSDFFVSSELVSTKLVSPSIKSTDFSLKGSDKVVSFSIIGSVRYQ